ncbi:MAG TPA: glycosyl hydrolase family 28-related protein, partial [Pyrinomonadaceae bacterium]|nr:glycosyl hydrolase family 28-related protein [Pyrinomonadaceae bacterium]
MISRTRKSLLWAAIASVLSLVIAPLTITLSSAQSAGELPVYNVMKYGAAADGKTLDTAAINKTIDAAAAAGGGTVYFPAGNYLSVSIHLKSNIALYLDQGATIIAANTSKDAQYDPPEPNQWEQYQDFGHSHWRNSLIWGENLQNVSILGPGKIWGKGLVRSGGQSRTQQQNDALTANRANEPKTPFGYPNPRDAVEPGWGNKAISLKLCRNVNIRDITIFHGGHFAILATGVDNLTIDNVKIDTNR